MVGSFQLQGGLVTKEELAKETDKECWWRKNVFPGIRTKARNKVVRNKSLTQRSAHNENALKRELYQ